MQSPGLEISIIKVEKQQKSLILDHKNTDLMCQERDRLQLYKRGHIYHLQGDVCICDEDLTLDMCIMG